MSNPAAPMLDLLSLVFALITYPDGGATPRYVGTGFFIGQEGQFLTAGHVLRDLIDPVFAVLLDHDKSSGRPRAAEVQEIVVADDVDVAAGRVVEPGLIRGIWPTGRHPLAGEDLLVVEYARSTEIDERGLGFAEPEVWKGYIVRAYKSDLVHPRPTYCYEVSVPAIAGASGAPVISMDTHTLVGMIVANVTRELMPASVERVERTDGATEETRFYLPHAEAIAYTELIPFVQTLDGAPAAWLRQRGEGA